MSLLIDTNVLIKAEKAQKLDLSRWADLGQAYISAITVSELFVGVEKADTPERKLKRNAFVEYVLATIPVLDFDTAVARTHAKLLAVLPRGVSASVQDGLIAATAVHGGHAVLTHNLRHFEVFASLQVLEWTPA